MSPAVENDPAKGVSRPAAETGPAQSKVSTVEPGHVADRNRAAGTTAEKPAEQPAVSAPPSTPAAASREKATEETIVTAAKPPVPQPDTTAKQVESPGVAAALSSAASPFGAGQVHAAFDHVRGTAEDLGRTCLDATRGVAGLQARMVAAAGENALVAFDLARDLAKARSISDAVDAQTTYLHRQLETLSAQARDMGALSTRLVQDVARPQISGTERIAGVLRDRT